MRILSGYIVDSGGYMRILTVIWSGVGSRDTCVSKNIVLAKRSGFALLRINYKTVGCLALVDTC